MLQSDSPQKSANAPVSDSEKQSHLRYVARQPILDRKGQLTAYELLFREGPQASFRGAGENATRTMLDNALLFGFKKLTDGLPAFINCTAEILTSNFVRILPPEMVVLEILETVDPTPDLISTCLDLKNAGYRFALDDFELRPGIDPLIELADFIKIDLMASDRKARHQILQRLGSHRPRLIAEKVEDQAQYIEVFDEGFEFFQGYYFCRPKLLSHRRVPANHRIRLELLLAIYDDPLDLPRITQMVKQDAALTYRLLKLANSPICAMRYEVRSVKAALVAIGDETFRRLAALAITTELSSGQPSELLHLAFEQGRFCERGAAMAGLAPAEQYLLGLLSLLPAMLKLPMEELITTLPLRKEICQALIGNNPAERVLLDWHMAHTRGDWAACDALANLYHLDPEKLLEGYSEAIEWASVALQISA